MEKTLVQIQKEIDDWVNQFTKPYFEPFSRVATMTEEMGEVARVINHMYGDKKKKDDEHIRNLEEEIGDFIFTIICMANGEKLTLDNCKVQDVNKFQNNYDNSLITCARMSKTVGDIADIIYTMYGLNKINTEELTNLNKKLNHAIYLVVYMANAESIDLTEAYEKKMDKVMKRDNNRWERKR
jgi:NTP pyrophosphatase (non-canonical NTP hydrolase)